MYFLCGTYLPPTEWATCWLNVPLDYYEVIYHIPGVVALEAVVVSGIAVVVNGSVGVKMDNYLITSWRELWSVFKELVPTFLMWIQLLTYIILSLDRTRYSRFAPNLFGGKTFFFFSSGPTTDIPSRKKWAIVQQTIGITDNVAVHQCVHYRPVYALQYILQSLWA